ncbi:MAG: hypothetical protein RLY49_79 [Candidatus Parcubacteria bacterium]|jgi:hypothetical protein
MTDFEESKEYKKIFKFSEQNVNILTSRESATVEFKESFNWGSKDEYAKTLSAFSNHNGGFLIFGVKNQPKEAVGLQTNNFENIDEAKITRYLNSIFSPEIEFEKFTLNINNRIIGILHVHPSHDKPVISIKNDGVIKEGEIYYRYTASSEKIKFSELKKLLNEIQDKERRQWMDLFKKVSKVGPENTALINMVDGTIEGNKQTLVIDEKLIPKIKFIQEGNFKDSGSPTLKLVGSVRQVSDLNKVGDSSIDKVRITNDPNAQAVIIKEENLLKEYSMDYQKLTETLKKRYSNFKINDKYHKIRRSLKSKGLVITRQLNPNNPGSTRQDFYSPKIVAEFDKHYKK